VIDVDQQINAVRRQVGDRVLEAGAARVVTIGQTYDGTIEEVWDACTDPERIPRWLMPITGDLRLGGRYQLEGQAGGVIERCDPPKGFAATWEFGGQTSWIELRLTPDTGGGTRFELDHIALVDERWGEFGPGAVGIGWDMMVMGLYLFLSSGSASSVDPAEAAAWAGSEEGRRFMTLSGERWCEADIAAGADAAEARAASDRTLAAYTAPPEA
jgi:uncharacterized protein YndB with AHSA1/START domain